MYGHTDGDLMENNSYFNHPLLPVENNTYLVAGPMEYVSTNPLTMQTGVGSAATTLLSLGSLAIVKGKPFMLSEWNEYGEHPFPFHGVCADGSICLLKRLGRTDPL